MKDSHRQSQRNINNKLGKSPCLIKHDILLEIEDMKSNQSIFLET